MSALVGRNAERDRLDGVIAAGGAVALVGEPGIGKTALLGYARERAVGRVLATTGAESESDLPFAGLLALLGPVLHNLAALPPVQARALEGALALGPPAHADRLVVHAAALGLLSAAAEEEPVLAVVDDAHWLDDASADALLFAARRLEGEPVALLMALRPVEGRRLDLGAVERLAVEGLTPAEAAELLRAERLAPEVVERLHAATAGNPLALLEAPAHLPGEQLTGRDPLGDPLPVGPGVQAGFRRRLERLPERTRTAMLLAAAAGADALAQVNAAGADLGVTLRDLEPAEADHLVEVTADHVRFRHPLVRAAAYQDAPAPERRAVHRALAAHTSGARRASHLWGAAAGPDPAAAAALEATAGEARGRTGFAAAALAMERAARLTAPGDKRSRRLFGAAQDRLVGGDALRAIDLAREALPEAGDPALAAEINGLLGLTEMLAGSLEDGYRTCSSAAETIAEANPARASSMLANAAMTCFMAGRIPLAYTSTLRAHEVGKRAGGVAEAVVDILLAGARLISGRDAGDGERALLDRWPDTIDAGILVPGAPQLISALQFLSWVERYADADAFSARVDAMAAEAGAVGALPLLRAGQLEVDVRRGDWAIARARASEALRLGEETGQFLQRSLPMALLARLEAAMGLEEQCRATVQGVLAFALPAGLNSMNVYGEAALGLLELGLGRAARAAEHLDEAARLCEEYGQLDPSVVQHLPDRVEAHIRAGHLDRAGIALDELAAMAERTQRPWPLVCVARYRGVLASDDAFDAWFARAYAPENQSPFELARTELCHGERLRRARRVREARERLRAAMERFEGLGAVPWAARARSELRAAGGAAAPERSVASRELTPQELEVALAVAGGATNREVASALYVSPKTVEVHLTRIFRKLGIRSRTELAARMANK